MTAALRTVSDQPRLSPAREILAAAIREVAQLRALVEAEPDIALSVSVTTRPPREGEIDGTHYHFITQARFDEMVAQAEQYAEQDKKRMEEAQIMNDADSLLYTAEKTKGDLAGKISKESEDKITAASADLRKAIESKNGAEVKAKTDALRKVLQDVGTAVYQQQAQTAQATAGGGAGPGPTMGGGAGPTAGEAQSGDGPMTDADYKVVDEDKK